MKRRKGSLIQWLFPVRTGNKKQKCGIDRKIINQNTLIETIDMGPSDIGVYWRFRWFFSTPIVKSIYCFHFQNYESLEDSFDWNQAINSTFCWQFSLSYFPGALPFSRGLMSDMSLMNLLSEHWTLNSRKGQWITEGHDLHFWSTNMSL